MTDDAAPVITVEQDGHEPILWTESLGRMFGTTAAVRDLNLRVEKGSITGIVGPNGAGKTTTFLMLSTLLMPTSGTAVVCGHDPVLESRDVRAAIGYMPDFFGIYDDLRVREYLDFFAASYGLAAAKRAQLVDDLLDLVDLAGKREAFVNSLSRGMKQRLGLARALVHDPTLLILDEPASGLDPRARVELRVLLHELQKMGKTILISSHILSELEEICSHVAIMEAGSLIAHGSPDEILSGLSVTRRFRVRAAGGGSERLRAEVERRAAVVEEPREDGVLEIEVPGSDQDAVALLRQLIEDGVPVIEFSEVETGLEEIFMRVTKGIVT
jgi:ABC-2 type transport system ATP-binding protein